MTHTFESQNYEIYRNVSKTILVLKLHQFVNGTKYADMAAFHFKTTLKCSLRRVNKYEELENCIKKKFLKNFQ